MQPKLELISKTFKGELSERFFYIRMDNSWNLHPEEVTESNTITTFKGTFGQELKGKDIE